MDAKGGSERSAPRARRKSEQVARKGGAEQARDGVSVDFVEGVRDDQGIARRVGGAGRAGFAGQHLFVDERGEQAVELVGGRLAAPLAGKCLPQPASLALADPNRLRRL